MLDWESNSDAFKRAPNDDIRGIFELASNDGRVRKVSERIIAKKADLREFRNQLFA
jgi:hypothetical protein